MEKKKKLHVSNNGRTNRVMTNQDLMKDAEVKGIRS